MKKQTMPYPRFALFGHPVSHSLSPRIHAAFAQSSRIALDYRTVDVSVDAFADALAQFGTLQGCGGNVTAPHKQTAFRLVKQHSDRAIRTRAVNTLLRKNDQWFGDNTDGDGFIQDVTQRHGLRLKNKVVLLIGAGGAARSVACALLDAEIGRLVIINRTLSHAIALASTLRNAHSAVIVVPWHQTTHWPENADLIINATSTGRQIDASPWRLPSHCLSSNSTVIDLNYGRFATPFLQSTQKMGSHNTIDGLGMLVEQAALSFALWFGVQPETSTIYAQLRHELDSITRRRSLSR